MNRIRHNSPSLIHCLRAFHILFFAYLLFCCYYYHHYKTPKILLLLPLLLLPLPLLSYYFSTKHFAADIKFPGVVELTTQLLILENILWLPLCRINKFGLNTLPSKAVAIPYTCGLSGHETTFPPPQPSVPMRSHLGPFPAICQRGIRSWRASTSSLLPYWWRVSSSPQTYGSIASS